MMPANSGTGPVCFDWDEYERWMRQATDTLESAKVDADHAFFNWACFKAQQAGEYAIKAILHGLGYPAIGHSIVVLADRLKGLDVEIGDSLMADARLLDRHYIPPRYPNSYPSGSPLDYYDDPTSQQAIEASRRVLRFVENLANEAMEA